MKTLTAAFFLIFSFSLFAQEEFTPIIEKSDECYKACKPRKKILGILGSKEEGLDRASCVACIEKNPEKYQLEKSIVMRKGSACYDSCKPSGIESFKKEGFERKECVPCLVNHPELYDVSPELKAQVKAKIKCEISEDESVATCDNGHVYKRDNSSVSDIERTVAKETEQKSTGKKAKSARSGAQRQ